MIGDFMKNFQYYIILAIPCQKYLLHFPGLMVSGIDCNQTIKFSLAKIILQTKNFFVWN